jgi:riboflavin synthase
VGESIAVNGACLTVTSFSDTRFDADCSKETAERTNLGQLPVGAKVHLERALRVGDRLGGHYVTGHVDAQAALLDSVPEGEATELRFELPSSLRPFVAEKGSITLDGVSLTVNCVTVDSLSVMIVPHTLRETHLGSLRRGNVVNVEVDVLSRYVVHLARLGLTSDGASAPSTDDGDAADLRLKKALAKAGML